MWHVETDVFALAVFLIMFIKEYGLHKTRKQGQRKGTAVRDIQSDSFYYVLVFSIISAVIDLTSSIAMNSADNWWVYQILMTIYVVSMPLLAVVWVGYAYVLVHPGYSLKKLLQRILFITIPYGIYVLIALSNPFTGLFFQLSDSMEYKRGILFMPVGVGFIMLYSAIGFLLVLFYWKRITPRFEAVLMLSFFIITTAFTWVQLANPGWLIINASYAVIYVWCDIAIEDQRRGELYHAIAEKNVELKATAEKAEIAAHAKSEFLSRMSHDIRTPMNAIIGLTHLAKMDNDVDNLHGYLNKIDSSSHFLLGLINDILDMSKIENGEMTLHEAPFTKDEFRDSIQTVIQPLIEEKNISFVFNMNCGVECICVDRLRFCQIFFNLLSNAAKFTPAEGTIEFLSERIEPSDKDEDGKVGLRIYVRDNGIGMSKEFQENMYNPFSQEKSQLSTKEKGTGLGLPIVKSLVEAMGGTISVKSDLGKGTEFKVEMYVKTAALPETLQELPDDGLGLKGVRILLVEDNELNVYVAKTILEMFSAIIYVAGNGREAVEQFQKSDENFFDVILMDVRMPVMDGIEATRCIRAMERPDANTVPIIAMTADAFDKEKKVILDSGMNCHMAKPIDPPVLYRTILKYITNHSMEDL